MIHDVNTTMNLREDFLQFFNGKNVVSTPEITAELWKTQPEVTRFLKMH